MTSHGLRCVIDTNVLVSASLSRGNPLEVVEQICEFEILLMSEDVASELVEVLGRSKFDRYVTQEARNNFLESVLETSIEVEIVETITACRDPKDNMLLELAVSGNADYLVTGDKDLLVLDPFRGIRIVSPLDFLKAPH